MEREELFLRTLEDLESRLGPAQDEYDVLGISALLRKLLLDAEPLVDLVNRDRHARIRFHVNVPEPIWRVPGETPPKFWSLEDGLDPETAPPRRAVREVNRDGLLGTVVMI